VVRDLVQQILGSKKSDHRLAIYGKVATLLIGALGVALALKVEALVFWFVLFAWSGLGAAFGPVTICLLYYRKTTREGVIAGMLGGFLTSVVWVLWFKEQTYGLYEAVPGFIVGMVATLVVSAATYKALAQADGD
jgi:Na+/proline symporter